MGNSIVVSLYIQVTNQKFMVLKGPIDRPLDRFQCTSSLCINLCILFLFCCSGKIVLHSTIEMYELLLKASVFVIM